ncbi:winged helix-turn-helix domain-containing protein [Psychromonas sp. KJ10-10]|uniref:winged helix-turn-helix domain-containing protein n=1 Tax=Psychromonas sp. KJ10-10 TaxID=3391823 RepID=UPI0039B6518B
MLAKKYIINDSYLFDPVQKTLVNQLDDSIKISLGSNESDLLNILIERRNEILSKDALNRLVWTDNGALVNQSSVVQAMSTLRKMLNDSTKKPAFILTLPKKGYQFVGSIKEIVIAPEPVPELAENLENDTNSDSIDDKQAINKKTLPLVIMAILISLIIAVSLYTFSISLQKGSSSLVKADVVNNIPIYTLTSQHKTYTDNLPMKEFIKEICA